MSEYKVEVKETHWIYVDAETEDEALDKAQNEAFNQVPGYYEAKIIRSESEDDGDDFTFETPAIFYKEFYICEQCAETYSQFIVELTYPQYEGVVKVIREANANSVSYCGELCISEEGFKTLEEANEAIKSNNYKLVE